MDTQTRTVENPCFSVTFDNVKTNLGSNLVGPNPWFVGAVVRVHWGETFASRQCLAVGVIRRIVRSGTETFTFECDRSFLKMDEERGKQITKTDFASACDDAVGQFMAFPCHGRMSENTALQKTENNTGQVKCWRVDTNIFLVGVMGSGSKLLELAYDKNFVDITATSTLGTGVYNSVTYDIITHTSTDSYIFAAVKSTASLAFAIRYNSTSSWFFDNLDGSPYSEWIARFAAMGYSDYNISIFNQQSQANLDFITQLALTFDLWNCPMIDGVAGHENYFLHLAKNEFMLTGDYTPDLTLNYSQVANYEQWVDFDNVFVLMQRCYWYMFRNNFFNRLPIDVVLPSDWAVAQGSCDLRYVYDDQIAYKLAMRHLFFNNKQKYYCSFDVPLTVGYLSRVGKLIKLNYPLGFFANTDRILQVMRMTYSPNGATVNFECLDYSFIVSEMKDIKLLIQSNTTDNNTTFYDFSPTGEHAITPVSNVIHDTAATKYGSTSIYFPGYVNPVMSYLSTPASADWEIFLQTNATVSFWVKFAVATGMQMIVFDYANSTNWWQIERLTNDKIRFCGRNTAGYFLVLDSGTTIADTNWHHVACVKVGALHGIYIDGVQVAYVSMASSITIAGTLYIGHHPAAVTVDLNGWLDEIMFSHDNLYGVNPNVGLTDVFFPPNQKLTWEG
jgi:hypothetical protein